MGMKQIQCRYHVQKKNSVDVARVMTIQEWGYNWYAKATMISLSALRDQEKKDLPYRGWID